MVTYQSTLAALAHPTRRRVFEGLRRGPRSVGELARDLPVTRPAVSQHLRVLKDAGLVDERRAGTRNYYSVNGGGLAELRRYLDDFWDDALDSFQRAAENERKEQ